MFRTPLCIGRKMISGMKALVLILAMSPYALPANELRLAEAESLALSNDPSVASMRARGSALQELEVAAHQLPDPMLKMGVAALPLDSLQLGQEPMTQIQLGVVQKFPRGDSRALKAEQFRTQAMALDENARDLELQILLSVREQYLEVVKQHRLLNINQQAETAFSYLADITQDYYATGRAQQQDVLRAAVELARVQERSQRFAEEEDRARANLATWIGDAAWRPVGDEWPQLPEPAKIVDARDSLGNHPRVLALHRQAVAAGTAVELAQQAYKPEFAIDLTYGGRGGTNQDGSARSDLFSVMVTMDLPLFTGKRQDRTVAASLAQSSAAAYDRDDLYRRMMADINLHHNVSQRQKERLALFETRLLPEAKFNAEAAFDAYQAALEDLTTLMRAQITEFDLELEYIRLQAEALKTRSRLLYFEGGES